jgi:hypothetical protein
VGLLWVSNCGVIVCLVDALIVGFVYGLKVFLFKILNSGVMSGGFYVYSGVLVVCGFRDLSSGVIVGVF